MMKAMRTVEEFFNEYIAPPHKIISVKKQTKDENSEDEWKAMVEIIEEKDYMKRYGNDEMIGLYEVYLDQDMEITGYARVNLRFRSDLEEQSS